MVKFEKKSTLVVNNKGGENQSVEVEEDNISSTASTNSKADQTEAQKTCSI